LWERFYIYTVKVWAREPRSAVYYDWLINPERFCQLACKYLKEGNDG